MRAFPLHTALTVLLVGVWYYGNWKFGFGLKHEGSRFRDAPRFLALSWTLFALAWLAARACRIALHLWGLPLGGGGGSSGGGGGDEEEQPLKPEAAANPSSSSSSSAWPTANATIVAANYLGAVFTWLAFVIGSVPAVQVYKSFAPIFTLLFSLSLLDAAFPITAVLAILLLVFGAALCSWSQPGFSFETLTLCMVTNLSLPFRNVLVKQSGAGTTHATPAHKLAHTLDLSAQLNLGGLLITTLLGFVFIPTLQLTVADVHVALRLAVFRTIYELASLIVLTRIDVLVHGTLDVFKRAAMTIVGLLALQSSSANNVNVLGALIVFATLLWYKMSMSGKKVEAGAKWHVHPSQAWRRRTAIVLRLLLWASSTLALRYFVMSQLALYANQQVV